MTAPQPLSQPDWGFVRDPQSSNTFLPNIWTAFNVEVQPLF